MASTDLELGPCQILFGVEDNETDLGQSEGGVVVTFETTKVDLKSDQYGDTPIDGVFTGQSVKVTVPLAEITFNNLELALNQTKKVSGGKYGIGGDNLVGVKLSDKANSLLLKKYVSGSPSTDTEDYLRFPKAAPTGTTKLDFNAKGQRILEVIFECQEDDHGYFYYLGDETAIISGS